MEYKMKVIYARALADEEDNQIKIMKADGTFLTEDLDVGDVVEILGGRYKVLEVIK